MHPLDVIRKFAHINPELEEALKSVMREHRFRRGDTIRGMKNLTTYTYFISSGSARVFYTSRSKEHTFEFAFENEFIMVSPTMVRKLGETITIQFLEPTTVIFMPHLRIKEVLNESGSIDDTAGLIFLTTRRARRCNAVARRRRALPLGAPPLSAHNRMRKHHPNSIILRDDKRDPLPHQKRQIQPSLRLTAT